VEVVACQIAVGVGTAGVAAAAAVALLLAGQLVLALLVGAA